MSTKGCSGFLQNLILSCLELELFVKIKKDLVSTLLQKPGLSITQDLNKIKKNSEHPFVDIGKQETCAKFQQEILNSMVVGARQNFQFFRQITWFFGNNRALSKFKYWILHYLTSTTKLQINQSEKPNFILTTKATLAYFIQSHINSNSTELYT